MHAEFLFKFSYIHMTYMTLLLNDIQHHNIMGYMNAINYNFVIKVAFI